MKKHIVLALLSVSHFFTISQCWAIDEGPHPVGDVNWEAIVESHRIKTEYDYARLRPPDCGNSVRVKPQNALDFLYLEWWAKQHQERWEKERKEGKKGLLVDP